ncbi:hypothetical protein DH2020_037451 [Rehmannia glutinosa]|uniref:CCHC-type domain-containing protein n=1 Tax=Rehmannia glutinosa TaxID=99300 RepID=A0ABR0V456_REHGL
MEGDIALKLEKFSLCSEEKLGIEIEEDDIFESKEECSRSLFRKVLGSKKANFTGIKKTLQGLWSIKEPVVLRELGFNLFQFVFHSEMDKRRVADGKTWSFENQMVIFKEWEDGLNIKMEKFDRVDIWVHVWNLPAHWMSRDVGFKIGNIFPRAKDVIISESGSIGGRFLKILASVDISKHVLRWTTLKLKGESHWIDFKYENIQGLCFYCGMVGHLKKQCSDKKRDIEEQSVKTGRFGDWLRAEDFGGGNRDGFLNMAGTSLSPVKALSANDSVGWREVQGNSGSLRAKDKGFEGDGMCREEEGIGLRAQQACSSRSSSSIIRGGTEVEMNHDSRRKSNSRVEEGGKASLKGCGNGNTKELEYEIVQDELIRTPPGDISNMKRKGVGKGAKGVKCGMNFLSKEIRPLM